MPMTTRPVRRLDRSQDASPLYRQLYRELLSLVETLKPGDRLPSERELIEMYQVSRITVHQALRDLSQTNQIVRLQGRGTFVSHPKVERRQPFLNSFTEDMRLKGHVPSSRLLRRAELEPAPDVQERLALEDGARTLYLERLMLADGQPIALHYTHLVLALCTNADEWFSSAALEGSIYAILEQRCGHELREAEETVEAAVAGPAEAKQLDVPAGAPLLWIRRVTCLADGTPIENSTMLYRSDRYRLVMRSARTG
jgi:GntR family transcriptional regulator